MAHPAPEHNPFMLMIDPAVVLAAMEKSERLNTLKRQLCRPLDRVTPAGGGASTADLDDDIDSDEPMDAGLTR